MTPQIGGDLDAALIQSGPKYVQPEKLLMAIFPIWVVAFLYKLMVAVLGKPVLCYFTNCSTLETVEYRCFFTVNSGIPKLLY